MNGSSMTTKSAKLEAARISNAVMTNGFQICSEWDQRKAQISEPAQIILSYADRSAARKGTTDRNAYNN